MTLRRGTAGDHDALNVLYREAFGYTVSKCDMVNADTRWAIAEEDGAVVGAWSVTFVRQPGRWNAYTTGLVVAPHARQRGIATALARYTFDLADSVARERDVRVLVITTVRPDRTASSGAIRSAAATLAAKAEWDGWDLWVKWVGEGT